MQCIEQRMRRQECEESEVIAHLKRGNGNEHLSALFFLFLAPDCQRGWMDWEREREKERGERAGGEYTSSAHIVLICPVCVFITTIGLR